MTKEIATMSHAYKSFKNQAVLKDVSLSIQQGQILGLIGPSGAGKSTSIKCLMGMEKLDKGETVVFDKMMPNRQILSRIGFMGQSDALYENLSAHENLVFFGHLMGMNGTELKQSIADKISLVHLEQDVNKLVSNFSGGMKRRLSLAITLLSNPDFLILDEPTVGIDPSLRRDIWRELRRLADKDKAIIVTTHVMDEAERCDLVALIIEGQILAMGSPEELKEAFQVSSIEEVFLKAEEEEK